MSINTGNKIGGVHVSASSSDILKDADIARDLIDRERLVKYNSAVFSMMGASVLSLIITLCCYKFITAEFIQGVLISCLFLFFGGFFWGLFSKKSFSMKGSFWIFCLYSSLFHAVAGYFNQNPDLITGYENYALILRALMMPIFIILMVFVYNMWAKKLVIERQQEKIQRKVNQRNKELALIEDWKSKPTLFIDVETNGLPRGSRQPRIVQICAILCGPQGEEISRLQSIIKPVRWKIPEDAEAIHGISTERAKEEGRLIAGVMEELMEMIGKTKRIVCHNVDFDIPVVQAELDKLELWIPKEVEYFCTMKSTTSFVGIWNDYRGEYKWPKLQELHKKLFGKGFRGAHDAIVDTEKTKDCYYEILKQAPEKVYYY